MMIVGDKRKYVLVGTKSLIRRLRQQDCGTLQEVHRHVQNLVKWNTFRDWAYRGCFRMPLKVFERLRNVYEIKDMPRVVTEAQWYAETCKRAAKTMHDRHPHKEWLSRAAKAGGEAVRVKYGIRYLTRLSGSAIHSSSKYRYKDKDGTEYRSRPELRVADLLRAHGYKFNYEPEIDGYIPDFLTNHTIIEVSGYFRDQDYLSRLQIKLAHLTSKGWDVIVVCEPRNKAALQQALVGLRVKAIMTTDEFGRWL